MTACHPVVAIKNNRSWRPFSGMNGHPQFTKPASPLPRPPENNPPDMNHDQQPDHAQ